MRPLTTLMEQYSFFNMIKYFVFIFFLATIWQIVSSKQLEYWNNSNFNKTFEFSFKCHQNQTGHWNTRVLAKKVSQLPLPKNWNVDLKFITSENSGMQTFALMGLITVPPRRPEDYELFHGIGYYKFYQHGSAGFYNASSICSQDGAHLLILNSEEESKVIQTIFSRHPKAKDFAFIGFQDTVEEGKFFTIFGEPLASTGFTRWAGPNQPDNAGNNEDCGSVHRNGGLNDIDCGGNWPFFCEYDLSWSEF